MLPGVPELPVWIESFGGGGEDTADVYMPLSLHVFGRSARSGPPCPVN